MDYNHYIYVEVAFLEKEAGQWIYQTNSATFLQQTLEVIFFIADL